MTKSYSDIDLPEIYYPPSKIASNAHICSLSDYENLYQESLNDADGFWKRIASELHFETWSDKGLEYNFDHRKGEIFVRFMDGARTNVAYNCLERNIQKGLASKVAIIWEGNEPGDQQSITYQELLDKVVNFSAVLRAKGLKKGDVAAIYLPMVIEMAIAMLACARIGVIHNVVFAGFSADSLANRMILSKAKALITADGYYRGNKPIPLKFTSDQALEICRSEGHRVQTVIMLEHLKRVTRPAGVKQPEVIFNEEIDIKWEAAMLEAKDTPSPVEWNGAEDPLFLIFTSGSTGVPKGLVHTTAGWMTHVYYSTKVVFDAQPDTVHWCTADCGWITGHNFVFHGPLMNGVTTVIFEGVPNYPDASRSWQIVEKYQVSNYYTAPTVVRALMAFPEELVTKHERGSLRVIGIVGEPINPTAWRWLHDVVGERHCAVVDTYFQTETGGHMIAPLPGAVPTKPGSAAFPYFGAEPVLMDKDGNILKGQAEGNLCFSRGWISIARTIFDDHQRYVNCYFSSYPGYYFTGDGARRDAESYYWIKGRVDDCMNVSGHLLSTAEIEAAILLHPDVVEAAVVSAPHKTKGQVPYAFVVLTGSKRISDCLINEIKLTVRQKIGPIATPEIVQEAEGLPKTRSGKCTRRILRKIAEGDRNADMGDTSTLIDENVIEKLWKTRPSFK